MERSNLKKGGTKREKEEKEGIPTLTLITCLNKKNQRKWHQNTKSMKIAILCQMKSTRFSVLSRSRINQAS